jgi:hypothetical protein
VTGLVDKAPPILTLVIETDAGTYIRSVVPATLLPDGSEIGSAAEAATRGAAAAWGLPDFVFRPGRQPRGSGNRELGDALLIAGSIGAVIQIKARRTPSTDPRRERSWLDAKVAQAVRQASGTIRSLLRSESVALTNERGNEISFQPSGIAWVRVVVLEHPGLDDYLPRADAVVLLRGDWEFLFDQLRSTYAVVEYLHRVKGEEPVDIGLESLRYYQLAAADAATAPSDLDSRLAAFAPDQLSGPLLPQEPVGRGEERFHIVFRAIQEDVAISPTPAGVAGADMHRVLAAIDAMPVAFCAKLGETLIRWLEEVALVRAPAITWRLRIHVWPDRPLLLFAAASRIGPTVQNAFAAWVTLRHQELVDRFPERDAIETVGVLLTPRTDGVRPWDTTMVATRGAQGLSKEDRALFEEAWGKFGERRPPS